MKKFVCKMAPVEVAKMLQEGNTIKDLASDVEYTLINGLLYNSETKYLGDRVYLADENLYFEVKESFEIKETGTYKLRNGKKAFVNYLSDKGVYGVVESIFDDLAWNKDGTVTCEIAYYKNNENEFDIVSKWEE